MKVLLFDVCEGTVFSVYAGCFFDIHAITKISDHINECMVDRFGSEVPHYEIQSDPYDNFNQYQSYVTDQENTKNTGVLNFTQPITTSTDERLEISRFFKNQMYNLVSSQQIMFILYISESIKTDAYNKKIARFTEAVRYVINQFDEYLNQESEEGIVLIDEIGGGIKTQKAYRANYYRAINNTRYSKVKAIFPGVISNHLFSMGNVIANGYQAYLEKCSKTESSKMSEDFLKNLAKVKIYSYHIYPKPKLHNILNNYFINLKKYGSA